VHELKHSVHILHDSFLYTISISGIVTVFFLDGLLVTILDTLLCPLTIVFKFFILYIIKLLLKKFKKKERAAKPSPLFLF